MTATHVYISPSCCCICVVNITRREILLHCWLADFVESALNSGWLLMSNLHHHRHHPVMATRLCAATSHFSINL
jgi:hypothetical protein